MNSRPNHHEVSIVLTSWNGRDLLRHCLRSVYEKTKGIRYEIVVVDDVSTEGSADMVRKDFSDVKLILNEINLGFTKADNRGVQFATGLLRIRHQTDWK